MSVAENPTHIDNSRLPRFGRLPHQLIQDPHVSLSAKTVFGMLDFHADGIYEGSRPHQSTLAEYAGCSTKTISRYLDELEERGWIERQPIYQYGSRAGTQYVLNPSIGDRDVQYADFIPDTSVRSMVDRSVGSIPDTSVGSNRTKPKDQNPRNKNTPASTDVDDGFDRFWDAYGKKVDKGHARKAWKRAVKKTSPETIIAAAEEYRAWVDRNETEQRYVAYPATWLNGERWNDEMVDHRELTVSEQLKLREKENS